MAMIEMVDCSPLTLSLCEYNLASIHIHHISDTIESIKMPLELVHSYGERFLRHWPRELVACTLPCADSICCPQMNPW